MATDIAKELADFIGDWDVGEELHIFAQDIGIFLLQFIDDLEKQKLTYRTVERHISNCYAIGYLECRYGVKEEFTPGDLFHSPEPYHEYEFKRKFSRSESALKSYRATWRKIYKYAKARGYLEKKS